MTDNEPQEPADELAALRAENAQMQARLDRLERAQAQSQSARDQLNASLNGCAWGLVALIGCFAYVAILIGFLKGGFGAGWDTFWVIGVGARRPIPFRGLG